jgi:hypothetical protein
MYRLTRLTAVTALAGGLLFMLSAQLPAEPVDPLRAAFMAIGASRLDSVRYSGIGATFAADPAESAAAPWVRQPFHRYDAEVSLATDTVRVSVTPVPEGRSVTAAAPLQALAGPVSAVVDGAMAGSGAVPRAWLSPHGFLKAARAHAARVTARPRETEVAFTYGRHRVIGFLNDRYQVDRVQTSGVEFRYRDYEPMPGRGAFPRHITETHGGRLTLDLWVWAATAVPAGRPVARDTEEAP